MFGYFLRDKPENGPSSRRLRSGRRGRAWPVPKLQEDEGEAVSTVKDEIAHFKGGEGEGNQGRTASALGAILIDPPLRYAPTVGRLPNGDIALDPVHTAPPHG